MAGLKHADRTSAGPQRNEQGHVIIYLDRVVTKRSVESILNERELLATLKHKFIVNMLHAFQDS